MDASSRKQDSEKRLEYLLDRLAIYDCICRYARGVDRHDETMTVSAYHADAVDEHGHVLNGMPEFGAWVNELHGDVTRAHTHNVTTHTCKIEGDVAHAESYVLVGLALREKPEVWFSGGRYIDRLERRDGEWRIAARRTLVEYQFAADKSRFHSEEFKRNGYPSGTRDKSDPSYMRPLEIDPAKVAGWRAARSSGGGS